MTSMFLAKYKFAAAAVVAAIGVTIGAGVLGSRALAEDKSFPHLLDDFSRLPPEAARWYTYATKPFGGEFGYRKIPWLVDLNEGVRAAKEENRPLFLWTSGDEPLEHC
jgi:hypothetical protein